MAKHGNDSRLPAYLSLPYRGTQLPVAWSHIPVAADALIAVMGRINPATSPSLTVRHV